MSKSRYLERGVSSNKEDVHNAIKNTDKGYLVTPFVKLFQIFYQMTIHIVM